MAVPWRRIAVPAAALGVLVPAALGAHALLPSLDDPGRTAVAADASPSASTAPDVPLDAPVDSADAGAAVAETPGNTPSGNGSSAPVRLSSYDARSHRAVLSAPKAASVRTGDVIASAPSRTAPSGALFKVAKVVRAAKGHTEVATAPATVSELLGDQRVDKRAALAPRQLKVRPLSAGVTTKDDSRQTPSASPQHPTLRLALDVPLPSGVEATDRSPARLGGEVDFSPELVFQYERGAHSALPERAAVGLGGTYGYGWSLHGKVPGHVDTGTVSVPLAAVSGQYTFWVGPVPVVVSAEVTFSYRFSADGRIVLDAEQHTTGSFTVGARYDRTRGWQPLHEVDQRTEGGQPRIAGAATATARIGAQASVFLYGAAGVGGDLSVYLKGQASAANDGRPGWALYAGYDLSTQLTLRLRIFGVELVDLHTTPFALHDERKLCGEGKP
ncbi:hypothetical protein ACFOSC_12610 [Streptantibioticus rubrisoli]|uniref:Lipoprotein n=1 Tax=Streptantibioticus rubrisoli TaxID=1387313 RepID=A0ABT1P832_9ACTN|nr:hypothetical protein [Streptantibioticus rubrisoli]MCQ4041530.1 hypothetical protein [Streptantibioticus rubrisoli]